MAQAAKGIGIRTGQGEFYPLCRKLLAQEQAEQDGKKAAGQQHRKKAIPYKETTFARIPYFVAGIYIHIPFCRKACHYCDFHFSTVLKRKNDMVRAIVQEMALQRHFLKGEPLETLYFGGGTPSLLELDELSFLLQGVQDFFPAQSLQEITLEANPDDVHHASASAWRSLGINRLSIGIQSFFEEDLRFMNRSHSAAEALNAIQVARAAGFENLSGDLIYGFPLLSDEKWRHNIDRMLALDLPHLSCYSLTVEEGTALAWQVKKGRVGAPEPGQAAEQFLYLSERLEAEGYEQYEISNFARPGRRAKHNSRYWDGTPYLGLGPSAHSFNRAYRQWNVAHNPKYIAAVAAGEGWFEREALGRKERVNELLLTGLRCREGVDCQVLQGLLLEHELVVLEKTLSMYREQQLLWYNPSAFGLTRQGLLYADTIAAKLFL